MTNVNVRKMEIYIQQLETQIQAKSAQIEQLNQYIRNASQDTQEIVSNCRRFCMNIMEKELIKGSVTPDELQTMPLSELTKRASQAYKNEQIENREMLEKFSEKLMSKNVMIQSLETQNAQLLTKNSQMLNSMSQQQRDDVPDDFKEDISLQRSAAYFNQPKEDAAIQRPAVTNIHIDDESDAELDAFAMQLAHESMEDQVSNVKKKSKSGCNAASEQVSVDKSEGYDAKTQYEVVDMGKIKGQLSDLAWMILEIIGKEGISEFPEIKQRILELNGSDSDIKITQINTALKELKKINAIDAVKINTGLRWFYAYNLQDTGHKMYVDKFKSMPVEPEINILSKEHDNPIHGYIIKDAAKAIREIYECSVSTSRKNNYIKLPNRSASIPDIIASKNGKNSYYEVETGHHTQADFNDKCTKLTMLTNDFYFIVPDQKTCDKLKDQIKKWVSSNNGGREALSKSNITVYLTTMHQLIKKNWIVVFDMSADEPIIRPNIGDDN